MKQVLVALPLFLAAAAAASAQESIPARMKLDEPQDTEREAQRPTGDGESMPVMDYIYLHSQLEAGILYTDFNSQLNIESDLGLYIRYGVEISPEFSVNLTYRHYDYESSEIAGKADEHVLIRGLLLGGRFHHPLVSDEFEFVANLGLGLMRWETNVHGLHDDLGVILSHEAGVTARLHEMLRFKAGLVLDVAFTDFHRTSDDVFLNLSFLFGLEFGGN